SANETGLLLRELARLGPTRVQLDDSGLPLLDALEPTDSHLIWTIELDGDASEAEVREVFDFVEMDCDLSITPLSGDGPAKAAPAAAEAQSDASALARAASSELDIAALLASVGAAPTKAPAAVVAPPLIAPPVIAAPDPVAPSPVVANPARAAPAPVQATPAAAAPVPIRVDLERVDRLITAVAELVIQQAMLAQRVTESGLARSSDIGLGLEDLELLTREIQDSVMAIRAQPVKSVFQRSEEHTSELQSRENLVCRLLLEKKKTKAIQ